ncbi:MAG: hypothetical protein U5N27_21335 [Rhizobium sp.]|nr:hypothetical protein [Rhizobium sp.]
MPLFEECGTPNNFDGSIDSLRVGKKLLVSPALVVLNGSRASGIEVIFKARATREHEVSTGNTAAARL